MTSHAWLLLGIFIIVLACLAVPLGRLMAEVFAGNPPRFLGILRPVERGFYLLAGVRADQEMTWKQYAAAILAMSAVGFLLLYGLQRTQELLPLNPGRRGGVPPWVAFNTAISFVTNTNWQAYAGETTMSNLVQMTGLTVQNFISAGAGIAVLIALARGLARGTMRTIGNFWVDFVRAVVYILLPLSFALAIALVSQGVVQTLAPSLHVSLLDPSRGDAGQTIPVGPVASQVAIKQIGSNGGGFFNANSAHPFEDPTPIAGFLELLAIGLIPVALCFAFGRMVGDSRQGVAILLAMLLLFAPFAILAVHAEQAGTPVLARLGVDMSPGSMQAGGNMEGKETRFGVVTSALWAVMTTGTSNGSVDSMHDSYTPVGGLALLALMQVGEVVFGGVGSGLYGMLLFAIVAVFVAGLMVGRTPEYLGKKVGIYEMKMASLAILVSPIVVLLGTAIAVASPAGRAGAFNPGAHGFSEILYAFSSAGNNNGSAFAGLDAGTPFYCATLGIAMFLARFWVIVPVLALAGAFAAKKRIPPGPGTLPTHGATFILLLVATVLVIGALTFLPALSLGPIVEALRIGG